MLKFVEIDAMKSLIETAAGATVSAVAVATTLGTVNLAMAESNAKYNLEVEQRRAIEVSANGHSS